MSLRSVRVLQSGVIAYRIGKSGEVKVLLVGRGKKARWGIPKGTAEPGLSLPQNAAKEAYEEAGVSGQLEPRALGKYSARKRLRSGDEITIEVWVYLLKVSETARSWPEKGKRRTKWVSALKAVQLLQEPLLQELCEDLAQGRNAPRPQGDDASDRAV
jgi:8-oxo-dGTP pyrophosphatase MutT (NUDIX family)